MPSEADTVDREPDKSDTDVHVKRVTSSEVCRCPASLPAVVLCAEWCVLWIGTWVHFLKSGTVSRYDIYFGLLLALSSVGLTWLLRCTLLQSRYCIWSCKFMLYCKISQTSFGGLPFSTPRYACANHLIWSVPALIQQKSCAEKGRGCRYTRRLRQCMTGRIKAPHLSLSKISKISILLQSRPNFLRLISSENNLHEHIADFSAFSPRTHSFRE